MATTVFVCIVLSVGSVFFSKTINDLVIAPIEEMVVTVDNISKNPLKAFYDEEKRAMGLELIRHGDPDAKKDDEMMETKILEKTLIKIGALLALGFGEAGSQIIAKNMGESSDINPMQ